jgi:hypothetical protein
MFALIRQHIAFFPETAELSPASPDDAGHGEETVDSNVIMPRNRRFAWKPGGKITRSVA